MSIKYAQYYATAQMKLHKKQSLSQWECAGQRYGVLLQKVEKKKHTHTKKIADNKRRLFGVKEIEIEQTDLNHGG